MLKLAKYLKEYILQIIFIFGLVFIQVMTDLQLPDYMSTIVNEGILGKDTGVIWSAGGKMLFVALISAACSVAVGYLAAKVGAGFSMNMRNRVFDKVEHFSFTEFDKFSTASLITRSTNDIQQIQMVLIMILRMVLSAPMMAVGAVIKAVDKSPSMTWIMALAVTILIGTVVLVFSIVLPKFKSLQKLVDKLNLVTRENLTGLRVIRAFNRADYEEEKFEKANQDLTQVNLFVNRTMIIMQPFMMLLMNVISITIIWVGAHMIDTGSLMVGDMMAFMQYTMQLIMSFLMITMMFIMIPRASVSAVRIAEILDTEPTIRDPKEPLATSVKGTKGVVEFKDVKFSYPGAASP
ncbi:MAG: ABC transporter permease, partial [Cellulosilyticaceae bacterium]